MFACGGLSTPVPQADPSHVIVHCLPAFVVPKIRIPSSGGGSLGKEREQLLRFNQAGRRSSQRLQYRCRIYPLENLSLPKRLESKTWISRCDRFSVETRSRHTGLVAPSDLSNMKASGYPRQRCLVTCTLYYLSKLPENPI